MGKTRILVVEDESIQAKLIKMSLKKLEYTVSSVAASGEEAIEKVKKDEVDLILMDIVLPGKLDGIETANRIRASANIPIIYLTANADKTMLNRAKITEPFGYLLKPFKDRELHINIEMALYKFRMGEKQKKLIAELQEKRANIKELLKSSSDYLQKLNDSLGDVILTVKIPDRIIEYVNRAVERVFGYKPDECIGKKTKMLYSETEEYNDFGRLLENAIKEGTNELRVEKLLKRKNGEMFPCEITTTFLKENEKIVQVISILHDISERKQAEKSLSDYKQQMYAFSLATTNMLWNLDLINNTIERNIGFEKAFGYTKKEIVPNFEWWVDRLHPDDRERVLSKFENTVKKDDSTCSCEYRFRRSDGNYSYIRDTVYIVRDENGKAIRALGAMTDITTRKEAEKMLREQKKALEQKTIALGEVIGQIQLEKQQVKDDVMANVENLLLPVIQKIRLKGESRKYIKLLQKNLQTLTSSFGRKLSKKETKLTPRELEICNMIKNGLQSKEIADLLNLSLRTLETHRTNIRKKLGLTQKEVNLASFLNSL